MILKKGQHYTLEGTLDILRAVIHKKALVLKDMRASYAWQTSKTSGTYFEGYQVEDQKLVPIMSYQSNGSTEKCTEHREVVSLVKLLRCEAEIEKIDLKEWSAE